jgi:hypothetical protein
VLPVDVSLKYSSLLRIKSCARAFAGTKSKVPSGIEAEQKAAASVPEFGVSAKVVLCPML